MSIAKARSPSAVSRIIVTPVVIGVRFDSANDGTPIRRPSIFGAPDFSRGKKDMKFGSSGIPSYFVLNAKPLGGLSEINRQPFSFGAQVTMFSTIGNNSLRLSAVIINSLSFPSGEESSNHNPLFIACSLLKLISQSGSDVSTSESSSALCSRTQDQNCSMAAFVSVGIIATPFIKTASQHFFHARRGLRVLRIFSPSSAPSSATRGGIPPRSCGAGIGPPSGRQMTHPRRRSAARGSARRRNRPAPSATSCPEKSRPPSQCPRSRAARRA